MGLGQCYLSDCAEHSNQTVTLWHAGTLPFTFSPPFESKQGPRIANHFIDGRPAVIESTIKEGMRLTIYRIWRLKGTYFMMAHRAESIEPKRHIKGTNGLIRLIDEDPEKLITRLIYRGMPHHIAVVRGDHVELFKQFAELMDIQWVH